MQATSRLSRSSFWFAFPFGGALGLAALVASLTLTTACGPSYQSVYTADVGFEHCYALDDRADAPLAAKRDCWQTWRTRFAVGQSRDKLGYAEARANALSRGTAMPTDDSMMAAAPGEAHVSQVVAPQTTNAFAPPPKVLDMSDGGVVDPDNVVNPTTPQITWSAASAMGAGNGSDWSHDAGAMSPSPMPANAPPGSVTNPKQTHTLALRDAKHPDDLGPAPGAACNSACTRSFGECRDTCKGGACNACDTGYRSCMRACFK